MLVPPEKVVVLLLLLISELQDVVVELGEHKKVGKGNVISHEKGPSLQMLLKVLHLKSRTFLSYLPSFS